MMLKPQDIVILIKILSIMTLSNDRYGETLSQNKLATLLCMSVSEVNAGTKRLVDSGLLGPIYRSDQRMRVILLPIKAACEECLIYGVKYFLPAELGAYTVGIPTAYAAPILEKLIVLGDNPIPVWPHAAGTHRGFALKPLYSSVPESLIQYPDEKFYEMLALVDAIRSGRARERNIAVDLLRSKINEGKRHTRER